MMLGSAGGLRRIVVGMSKVQGQAGEQGNRMAAERRAITTMTMNQRGGRGDGSASEQGGNDVIRVIAQIFPVWLNDENLF